MKLVFVLIFLSFYPINAAKYYFNVLNPNDLTLEKFEESMKSHRLIYPLPKSKLRLLIADMLISSLTKPEDSRIIEEDKKSQGLKIAKEFTISLYGTSITKQEVWSIFGDKVLFSFAKNWLDEMYSFIISSLPTLSHMIEKNDIPSKQLIQDISKNPAKYDLTYAMWLLAKNDLKNYIEDLEDFETEPMESIEEEKKEEEVKFPEIGLSFGA